MSKTNIFNSPPAKKLWKISDDAIRSGRLLSEIYNEVPKEIANVHIETLEFHRIDCPAKLKKKVMKWLGEL